MAVGLENRLKKITDSLKELKVSYATVGSAVSIISKNHLIIESLQGITR